MAVAPEEPHACQLSGDKDQELALAGLRAAIENDPEEEGPVDLIPVYESLGDLHSKQGNVAEAIKDWRKCVALSEKAYPRRSGLNWERVNVRLLCKLAKAFQLNKDDMACLNNIHRAIDICENTSHNFLESKLPNLYYCYAHCSMKASRLTDAWTYYNKTLSLSLKVDKHLATLSMFQLGNLLIKLRRESRAQKYFEEALKMAIAYLGTVHVLTGLVYEALAMQMHKNNDNTNTLILLEKAIAIFTLTLGHQHPFTLRSRAQFDLALNRRKFNPAIFLHSK